MTPNNRIKLTLTDAQIGDAWVAKGISQGAEGTITRVLSEVVEVMFDAMPGTPVAVLKTAVEEMPGG